MTEFSGGEFSADQIVTDEQSDAIALGQASETPEIKAGWADPYIDRISIADPVVREEMITFMRGIHNPPHFVNPKVAKQQQAIRERLGD